MNLRTDFFDPRHKMKFEHTVTINDPNKALVIRSCVQMAVKPVTAPGVHVSFRTPDDARFQSAIAFGASWAGTHAHLGGNRQGLDVMMFFIQYEHRGPRIGIIALLAALCACDALGIPAEVRPRFDESEHVVTWPL